MENSNKLNLSNVNLKHVHTSIPVQQLDRNLYNRMKWRSWQKKFSTNIGLSCTKSKKDKETVPVILSLDLLARHHPRSKLLLDRIRFWIKLEILWYAKLVGVQMHRIHCEKKSVIKRHILVTCSGCVHLSRLHGRKGNSLIIWWEQTRFRMRKQLGWWIILTKTCITVNHSWEIWAGIFVVFASLMTPFSCPSNFNYHTLIVASFYCNQQLIFLW